MHCFAVSQCYDAKEAGDGFPRHSNFAPEANTAVRLGLPTKRGGDYFSAPSQVNVGSLASYLFFKIPGCFHVGLSKPGPANARFRISSRFFSNVFRSYRGRPVWGTSDAIDSDASKFVSFLRAGHNAGWIPCNNLPQIDVPSGTHHCVTTLGYPIERVKCVRFSELTLSHTCNTNCRISSHLWRDEHIVTLNPEHLSQGTTRRPAEPL